jgi:predicted GNAT family acetyltransferase
MVIHCIWVVGQHKGHGYGSKLLEQCLNDARDMNGVAVVTTAKTWLPHSGLFMKHGFQKVDEMPPHLELYAKRFKDNAPMPRFNPVQKERLKECGTGLTVFKADQCPYTNASVRAIEEAAKQAHIPARVVRVKNCREAQDSVHPYGTFCVLLDGELLAYHPIGKKDLLESLKKTQQPCR